MVRQTHFSFLFRKEHILVMARHKCIAFTKLQHYSVNQYTNGVYLSLFNYLIVKCRHTNKTSGKDATGLHGAS